MNAKDLIALINRANYEAESYAGRGMVNARCVAFRTPAGVSLFKVGVELASACRMDPELDDLSYLGVKSDTMGMGAIVYFPDVKWKDDEYLAALEAHDDSKGDQCMDCGKPAAENYLCNDCAQGRENDY